MELTLNELLAGKATRIKNREYFPTKAYVEPFLERVQKLTSELNGSYHDFDEIRKIFSKLIGKTVDDDFRVFPPFFTDFGKNIHLGKNVFINAGCKFQDQGGITIGDNALIGHNVVLATINHNEDVKKRGNLIPAPIKIGNDVWIGSNATILLV